MNKKKAFVPIRSPFGLLQEDLWPNTWLLLVSCMMLNCTTRAQVEKVLPRFIELWPTVDKFTCANPDEVKGIIAPLGFKNRRTDNLFKMSRAFKAGSWKHARELPGVGEYAARAWEIFCCGKLGDEPPKDHALVTYWKYCKEHEGER